MAGVQNGYAPKEAGAPPSFHMPRVDKVANTIVRAATEESEELTRHDSHIKQAPMRPPMYQRPIPTKPDGYGYYQHHHYGNPPHSSGSSHQTSPGHRQHQTHHGQPPSSAHPPTSSANQNSPSGPRHSVQSVITSSFSIGEDGSFGHERGYPPMERRHDGGSSRTFRRTNSDPMERREPPNFVVAPAHNESPKQAGNIGRAFSSLSRSFSSGSDYYNTTPPMKRSFFHHVKSSEQSPNHLPPEFMPPKRNKTDSPPRKEVTIMPRVQKPDQSHGGWSESRHPYHQRTWESREDDYHRDREGPMESGPPPYPSWNGRNPGHGGSGYSPIIHRPAARLPPMHSAPPPPHHYEQESPHSYSSWGQSPSGSWGGPFSPSAHHESRNFWGSPSHSWQQHRDDIESSRDPMDTHRGYRGGHDAREHAYESEQLSMGSGDKIMMSSSRDQQIFRSPSHSSTRPTGENKMGLVVETVSFTESHMKDEGERPTMLLSLPQDEVALSETLCVVRKNVEVFRATQSDVDAPAPGRKHAVVVGQVGLRCIHCRHTTRASDRVKRAVCYPSSIKRIYRTVIDMKLDHFSQCKFVPPALTEHLDKLKSVHTRSTGTTMQYFIKAAHMLGMEDSPNGVVLNMSKKLDLSSPQAAKAITDISKKKVVPAANRSASFSTDSMTSTAVDTSTPKRQGSLASSGSFGEGSSSSEPLDDSGKYFCGVVPLALPEDKTALSQLRCFLREQVCAFSATEEDIAVRAPTTFQITVGQVGIGCVHCVKQPPKYRSNRAVCFPFSINRIYQSVADIQRFHFAECKMLPQDVKEKFVQLQKASSKGSKGLATRQYWVTSAQKLGLVNTSKGIRFGRDPSEPQQSKAVSLDILAQAAFSVTTTNKKLVLPEDKEKIADFLYVVMEQLQPCRFTEADRNKRRVRDVGCIGVECKHCAGQVDSRKFFWSSVSAVESNFVSVHTHMLECRMVPKPLKDHLIELKKLRKAQTAELMTGSQKAFFRRVWERLHKEEIVAPKEKQEKQNATSPKPEPMEGVISKGSDIETREPVKATLSDDSMAMDVVSSITKEPSSPPSPSKTNGSSPEPMQEDCKDSGYGDAGERTGSSESPIINTMEV